MIKIMWRSNNRIYKDFTSIYTSNSLEEYLSNPINKYMRSYWRFIELEPKVYRAIWKGNK